MYATINDDYKIEPKEGTLMRDYFGDTELDLEDIINAFEEILTENEELKRKIEEDYQPKHIDYYEEYGMSENDFH